MYPTENKVYVPTFPDTPRDVTIEEARKGKIVAMSDDGTRATVQVTIGLTVCYCGVTLDSDGKICEFIPRPKGVLKTTAAFTGPPKEQGSYNPEPVEKPPE